MRTHGHSAGHETFLKELGWREFCAQLLFHHPELPAKPLDRRFEKFKWRHSSRDFRAWTKGRTGIPIVDAGMRQLWQTGWMHNRVRMIVASFLIKHLGIHWQRRRLVLGHAGGCRPGQQCRQLAMGGRLRRRCGAFLPHFQPGAAGQEIRSRAAPMSAALFRSWRACRTNISTAPGRRPQPPADYPAPIVDLAEGRDRALKSFKALKR